MKKLGTYQYKFFRGAYTYWRKPVFEDCKLRVEVIDESKIKYKVRYLGFHANGSAVGYITWIFKTKVTLDEPEAAAPRVDLENIRLPYKD